MRVSKSPTWWDYLGHALSGYGAAWALAWFLGNPFSLSVGLPAALMAVIFCAWRHDRDWKPVETDASQAVTKDDLAGVPEGSAVHIRLYSGPHLLAEITIARKELKLPIGVGISDRRTIVVDGYGEILLEVPGPRRPALALKVATDG